MASSFLNRLTHGTAMLVFACALAVQAQAENYSDLWWNPAESGWGITIADHESSLFAVWLTYREDGHPTWMVMPDGMPSADRRHFTADIYATSAPPDANGLFDPSLVRSKRVGSASFDFAPEGLAAGSARFAYTVGTVQGSKVIERQSFGNGPAQWGRDFTDLWWSPDESGRGMALTQHGDRVFGVVYTYDGNGHPTFHVMPNGRFNDANLVVGDIYTTVGPWFGGDTFNPAHVIVSDSGVAGFAAREWTAQRFTDESPCPCSPTRLYYSASIDGGYRNTALEPMAFGAKPPRGVAK
jgi:hypothetical protein